ncbi:V-type proton ATPase subunit H-like [Zophobas morio]|uniref:V-type proton ATPase subunit H-like n=1 Tax=Zophobas morio TaxID=2755281 RepID=UPI0030832E37
MVQIGIELEPSLCRKVFVLLTSKLDLYEEASVDDVLLCLMTLLQVDSYRVLFYNYSGSVESLFGVLLTRTSNFQIQYQTLFCLWVLTFNKLIASSIVRRYPIIRTVTPILLRTSKEKVVRISLSTLLNLLVDPETKKVNGGIMITNNLKALLQSLKEKKWKDTDIPRYLEELLNHLEDLVQEMSSWDYYCAEVKSGELSWSAVHKSEEFWLESAVNFNNNDYEVVRRLHQLLASSNPTVVAVAAHDLGQYALHCSCGKSVIEKIGGKETIITLLEHEHPLVRHEALLALKKLIAFNWPSLDPVHDFKR